MNQTSQRFPSNNFYRNEYYRSFRDGTGYPLENGQLMYQRNEVPMMINRQRFPMNYGYRNMYQQRYPRYDTTYQNRRGWYGQQPVGQGQAIQQPMTYIEQGIPFARNFRNQRDEREYREPGVPSTPNVQRNPKEKGKKDLAYINRGTKVEAGQKVQFLEPAKNNQKN